MFTTWTLFHNSFGEWNYMGKMTFATQRSDRASELEYDTLWNCASAFARAANVPSRAEFLAVSGQRVRQLHERQD
jgi:hypothetical protein